MSAPLEAKTHLAERGAELHEQLTRVGQKLSENDLPDVRRDADKVRITHLEAEIPEGVEELARKAYGKVRPIKITQLLVEIDQVTHFSRHATHLHRGDPVRDSEALFTASLRLGTVTASLLLRKLASYPRQNGLAWALREVGRLEKTLFTLEWLQSVELRRYLPVLVRRSKPSSAMVDTRADVLDLGNANTLASSLIPHSGCSLEKRLRTSTAFWTVCNIAYALWCLLVCGGSWKQSKCFTSL